MAIHSFAAITKTNASGYHPLVFFVSILGISLSLEVEKFYGYKSCIRKYITLYIHTDMYKCN
jgi:hypothetical protein